MANKIHLLVIDPQHDFCNPTGALFVNGADQDMLRLAAMVDRLDGRLDDVHVTMDSHHFLDVAHPSFWVDTAGNPPAPFTIISHDDVANGKWATKIPSFGAWALTYTDGLAKSGRYPLCVWPPHCLIGSQGHQVVPALFAALLGWENRNTGMVNYITKGSNFLTEHYSAVKAEVPDPQDPTTQLNLGRGSLIQVLQDDADIVAIAGEASSHCVANTLRDIINGFNSTDVAKKVVLLTDAMSPVPGFEFLADQFFADMAVLGVQTSTTIEFLK